MKASKHPLVAALLALAVLVGLAPSPASAQQDDHSPRSLPWSKEAVHDAETLPIQDGGRIKPLDTYARFLALRLHGSRRMKSADGESLSPTAWLLDTLLFPRAADDYPVFLVQNPELLEAIGVSTEGKKVRDRYSFNELAPGIPSLFKKAQQYSSIEAKDRTSLQQQIVVLATNMSSYDRVRTHLDFARETFQVPADGELATIFGGRTEVRFSDVMAHIGELKDLYNRLSQANPSGTPSEQLTAVTAILSSASDVANASQELALIPPVASTKAESEWYSPEEDFLVGLRDGKIPSEHIAMLANLEDLVQKRQDPAGRDAALSAFHDRAVGLATTRGEYGKIGLEVTYYKSQVLYYSLIVFVLAFLLAAFMWLAPRSKFLYVTTSGTVVVGTLLLVAAIVMRCMIRGRPPVSTLYETILFVSAVGTIVAMITELINRRRVGVSMAAIVGMLGLFIAGRFEMIDKTDTMPSLVAVLDTNFWLATHVTCITIGYSAGMLAAFLASGYLVMKALGLKRSDRTFYRNLSRMTYGTLCFAVIFSVVGTILGGVWANQSWGRFWGWDPKENGALLIVLAELAILHSRLGGYLRQLGIAVATAFLGTVIAFSWFGVNLLGVGLHSYGFTSGIHSALWTYYIIQWGIAFLGGGVVWYRENRLAGPAKAGSAVTTTRGSKAPSGKDVPHGGHAGNPA